MKKWNVSSDFFGTFKLCWEKNLTLVFRLVGERAARKRVVVVTLREAMLMRRDLIRQPPCRLWQVCGGDMRGAGMVMIIGQVSQKG